MNDNRGRRDASETRMPEDFWQLVRSARMRAQAEVKKKRQAVYETFITDEVKNGKRIPMPTEFWEAVETDLDSPPPLRALTPPQLPPEAEISLIQGGSEGPLNELLPISAPPPAAYHYRESRPAAESSPPPSASLISGQHQPAHYSPTYSSAAGAASQLPPPAPQSANRAGNSANTVNSAELANTVNTANNTVNAANGAVEETDRRGLSFKDAALIILSREGRPMTAREIVTVALNEGLLSSAGKTPDASLAGQIYTDIHRNRDASLFVIVGPRTYALKSSPAEQAASLASEPPRSILPGNFHWQGQLPPTASEPNAAELESSNKKMSYKQVALHLLERERRPMTAKEIVTIAIEEGLIESTGKTPDATLAGQLYTEIQRTGARSPIKLIAPRTYALSDWQKS